MNRHFVVAALSGAALAVATGEFAVWRGTALPDRPDRSNDLVAWSEVAWPKCKSAGCGGDVHVYLRAKLGFCNCATGVANDDDLDRMSDFDLVGGEVAPLASGQPVKIGNMNGRDRAYLLTSANPPGKSALSVVFNDRCDMVVATAVLPHDRPATVEQAVIAFLNSPAILRWTEVTLGL